MNRGLIITGQNLKRYVAIFKSIKILSLCNGISRVYLQINLNTFERQISHEKNGLSKVTIIHSWPHWGLRGGRANGHIWSIYGRWGHILPIYGHRMDWLGPRKRRKKKRASWVAPGGSTCGPGSPESRQTFCQLCFWLHLTVWLPLFATSASQNYQVLTFIHSAVR